MVKVRGAVIALTFTPWHSKAAVLCTIISPPNDYYGPLSSNTPAFRSAAWTSMYRFTSSHFGELTALWHFVERTDIYKCLLVWVSDSQSAVVGVNKGTCRPDDGLAVLALILERCDLRGIVLLAF